MTASFIRSELQRLLAGGEVHAATAVGLRSALRLLDVVGDDQATAIKAEVLAVALAALSNAYRADWSAHDRAAERRRSTLPTSSST
jgi:hypothetical protein